MGGEGEVKNFANYTGFLVGDLVGFWVGWHVPVPALRINTFLSDAPK